jgi:hypothetical protein
MCDPTSKKQGCVCLRQIGWVEGVSVGEEIADVIEGHDDHHQAAKHINGAKT